MLSIKRTKTNSNLIITISTCSNHQLPSPSAETIANNDDLLTELLLCLPIKSLLKFKSVSKHWLALITNPRFSHRLTPISKSISDLFVYNRSRIQQYDFINLTSSDPSDPPFQSLTFLDNRIVQSCHGLMLLHTNSGRYERSDNYCVYNPTTRQCLMLPPFPVNEVFNAICGINLAYDPSKSPHYKVICVRGCENLEEGDFQIEIYSSKIGFWRKSRSSGIFTAHYETNFGIGTFWNSALHWISPWDGSLYFDVDEEKVHDLPMPAIHADFRRRFMYFGESRDHLHLIEIYGPCTALFNVYEMERDYSGWMIKYRVDLLSIAAAFPEMVRSYRDPLMEYLCYYGFSILSIVREEEDEDSYLVVHIPNKAIRYNFKDKSFEKVHEFAPVGIEIEVESTLEYKWCHAVQYTESLAYV